MPKQIEKKQNRTNQNNKQKQKQTNKHEVGKDASEGFFSRNNIMIVSY